MMFMVFGSFNVAAYEQNPEASAENQSLKIAIISDIHVTPQSMWGNCPCSAAAVIADRRMTAESQAIFEAVITDIIAEAPDVVLIPGDLTRNGEYHAHRYVAGRLDYLQSALPQATILVINGDHDINNPNAHDFSTCPAVPIPTVTPVQFREIYNNFGFGNLDNMYFIPSSGQAGGLSYVSRPADGFTIIAIDTTDGNISSELLAWVLEQADQAQDRGDTVIAFMHYNLIPHFSMQPELMPDSLVNNFGAIGQSFADAGIRYVFTGHLHAQSIAELTTTNGNTVFDIQTGSPVTYPSPVRYAIFTKTVTGDIVEREVNIRTTNITEIDFNCPITGQRITNLQQYGWDNSLNRAMLDGLISDLLGDDLLDLSGVIQDLLDTEFTNTRGETHTGLRAIIESALPIEDTYGNPISNDLADFIIDTLRSELPMDLDGLVTVLDQPNQNRIRMNALGGVGGVSITYANLRVHLVDSIFNQFDTLLGDEDFVNDLLESILAGLIDMTIYTDGANEYSVFDFIQYVYLSAMAGDATSEPWVDAIIAGLNDGSITNEMADYLVALLLPELNDLLNNVTINTGALITADTGFAAITSIPLRLLVLSLFGDPANLGSLLSTFGMDITELLGDAGGDLIPNEILDDLGGMVVDLAVSLLAGSNSAHSDNNTVLHWVGEYNPTPVFAITLTPDGDYYFSASQHYDDSNIFPHIVTITNTGNQPTGDLTVSLSGLNAGSFVIDNTTIPSIAVEGTASFSVIPMMGLGPGNYWATVTVSGEYVETQAFNVCFSFVYMPTGVLFVMSVSYENMEPVTSRPTLTFNGETIEPFWGYHYFYVPRFAVVGDVVVVEVPGFRPVTHYVNADDVSMQSVIIIIPESYRAWTVTFDLNEGELISGELVQTVDNNGNAVPPVVERDGYVFVGWNPEGGYNNITDNITITAIWEAEEIIPVQWTVTFDLNSGVLVEGESVQLVVYGGNATPPVVEREGFEFLGWYPAGAYNNITDDTTVTANWIRNIPERFIVTFDPNGGVLAAGDLEQLVRHGNSAIPPIVERENYIFIGWDPAGGYNSVTGDITITAIWEIETSLLQLPIPTGIAISGNILTWNTVADAVGYRIYVNEIAQTDVVIETSFNLANLGLGTGTHVIQIRALGNGIDTLNSSLSDTINFVLQRPSTGGGGGTNRFTPETQPAQPPTAIQPTPEPPDEELSPRYGFEDVNTGHWFHDYVTTVVANRLFQDAGTTHFAPDGTMSRAMFVQVLANHKDVDLSAYSNVTPTFYDVMPNAEYFAAVEWAAGQDLILGIGNGNFAPGAPITREQVAAVLYRYINVVDIRLPQSYAVSFADQNYISYWAIGAVNAIQRAGIVNGRPDDIFDPQANASRAETAAIFARFLSAIQ